jgi:hypothetical protein
MNYQLLLKSSRIRHVEKGPKTKDGCGMGLATAAKNWSMQTIGLDWKSHRALFREQDGETGVCHFINTHT